MSKTLFKGQVQSGKGDTGLKLVSHDLWEDGTNAGYSSILFSSSDFSTSTLLRGGNVTPTNCACACGSYNITSPFSGLITGVAGAGGELVSASRVMPAGFIIPEETEVEIYVDTTSGSAPWAAGARLAVFLDDIQTTSSPLQLTSSLLTNDFNVEGKYVGNTIQIPADTPVSNGTFQVCVQIRINPGTQMTVNDPLKAVRIGMARK